MTYSDNSATTGLPANYSYKLTGMNSANATVTLLVELYANGLLVTYSTTDYTFLLEALAASTIVGSYKNMSTGCGCGYTSVSVADYTNITASQPATITFSGNTSATCPVTVNDTMNCLITWNSALEGLTAGTAVCTYYTGNSTNSTAVVQTIDYTQLNDGSIVYRWNTAGVDSACYNQIGNPSGSSKTLWIILGVVAAILLFVVIAVVVIMVLRGKKKDGDDENTMKQPLNWDWKN